MLTDDRHVAVQVTWQVYQQIIAAFDEPVAGDGKRRLFTLLKRIRSGLPAGLSELATLGRTLWRKRSQILAYFDTGATNGPVEAINGRLEHLRGIALGFRNKEHYILVVVDSLRWASIRNRRTLKAEEPGKAVQQLLVSVPDVADSNLVAVLTVQSNTTDAEAFRPIADEIVSGLRVEDPTTGQTVDS